MTALLSLLVPAALALVGLFIQVARLRRALVEAGRALAAHRSSGVEHLAVLEEANGALRCKNRQLQTQLMEVQGELAALSYAVSHDLRAPLRSINGFSEALAEDYGPGLDRTARNYLQRVRNSACQLHTMVDALLGLSRLVRAPFRSEMVDLSALADGTLRELAAAEPCRRVEWYVQEELRAQGDHLLLAEVLRQLLGNAWKFSAVRTVAHLSFRVRPANGTVPSANGPVYEVRDDGVGFDPQYAGKLFGAFQRLHAPDEFPGLGMGLAAAQRAIHRHGGGLWATAEPDGGAVFSFTLPPEQVAAREEPGLPVDTLPPIQAPPPGALHPKSSVA